jgi:tRNA pseudouridine55 synthase
VVLHAVEISALRETTVELSVHCASGFYVRSFARDLARALGTVGHLTALRRTQSGAYRLAAAVPFLEIEAAARGDQDAKAKLNGAVLPIAEALAHVPTLLLDEAGAEHARHGRVIPLGCVLAGGGSGLQAGTEPVLLLDGQRVPLALGRVEEGGVRVVRGLRVE